MHRFPSKSVILRFRFSAVLFILRCALLVLGIPLLLWSMLMDIRESFYIAVGMLGFFPVAIILQWLAATKARCPLCFAQPLIHSGCVKSRKVRRLFFSYRLQVSLTSLLKGYFRCPYCGEPSEMKARERVPMERV